jgi:hypothetical protein
MSLAGMAFAQSMTDAIFGQVEAGETVTVSDSTSVGATAMLSTAKPNRVPDGVATNAPSLECIRATRCVTRPLCRSPDATYPTLGLDLAHRKTAGVSRRRQRIVHLPLR